MFMVIHIKNIIPCVWACRFVNITCLLVVAGGECVCWGRLHDDKLHDLYTARNVVTEMDVEYNVLVLHVESRVKEIQAQIWRYY